MANSVTSGRFILGLKIEGVGDGTVVRGGVDGVYRWVTSRALLDAPDTVDADDLFKDGLLFWPSEMGFSANFRTGSATVGTQTFKLRGHSTLWEQVFRYQHAVGAKLASDCSRTATTIVLDTTGLSDTVIFLEREAILLGSVSGVGPFTYQVDGAGDGSRGVLGTNPVKHTANADDDVECFTTLNELSGRTTELIRIDMGATTLYEETVLWTGVLRKVRAPEPHLVEIQADSAMSLLRGGKIMRRQWQGYVPWEVDLDPLGPWSVYPIGFPGSLAGMSNPPSAGHGDYPDRKMVISNGDATMVVPWVPVAEGTPAENGRVFVVEANAATPFGESPTFGLREDWPGVGDKLYEILTSAHHGVADTDTEAKNTLPLASNPGVLLLQILLTTEQGGNHATYDTAVANLAGGIPSALVNVDQIERWMTRQFGSQQKHIRDGMRSFHLGVDGSPEDLDEVIKRILTPHQAVLIQGEAGKLEVATFADALPFLAGNAITESQILSPGVAVSQDRRVEDGIDSIDIEYNAWPGGDADHLEVQDAYNQLRKLPGWATSLTIDMSGIADILLARNLAESLVIIYHDPIPRITLETTRLASYWPGDVVSVSHEFIFGAAAVRSVAAAAMLVVGRAEILTSDSHSIRYELDYVGSLYGRTGRIAPSAVVTEYADSVITVSPNAYTSATEGEGLFRLDVPNDTSDNDLWEVGDFIQICDEYGTLRAGNGVVEITAVADNTLTIDDSTLGGADPAEDDIIRLSLYGDAATGQQDRFVFIADASNQLDGGDGYDYVAAEADET